MSTKQWPKEEFGEGLAMWTTVALILAAVSDANDVKASDWLDWSLALPVFIALTIGFIVGRLTRK